MNFFAELKRRNVYKVAAAYAVVAWLTIQAASIFLPAFNAPQWAMQIVILILVIGFPIALAFSWAFEITPQGIVRESEVNSNTPIVHHTGRKIVALTIVLAVVATGLLIFQFIRPRPGESVLGRTRSTSPPREDAGAARTEAATVSNKSIAVLPFENLSDDKGAAYFAEGIQDEILTKLATIADLKVISRTSTAKYKSKPEDLKTVSQQLGVATVLEGSVQKAGGKVRVNVQLIDARADSHLWAKSYDRDIQDIFAVESEVAQEIADALKAKLSPAEVNTVASAPTKDMQAYDLFLKGEFEQRVANNNLRGESFDQALLWYKEAIARDPNFALAIAQQAICRLRRHWLVEPLPETELREIGQLAQRALSLAPDLAEAHVALGVFHYYGFREYEAALAQFQRAVEIQPNNSSALQFVAFVHRRQARWAATVNELKRAMELDPRDASLAGNLAQTYCLLRQWKEAEENARQAQVIDPHEATGMRMLLLSRLNRTADVQECRRLVVTFPPDELLTPNSGTYVMAIGTYAEAFVLGRDFNAALKASETTSKGFSAEGQRLAAGITIRFLAGDMTGARTDADGARELLEARLRDHPGETRSLRALSWVYLALGRKNDAIELARQTVDLLPADKDSVVGSSNLTSLAEMHARTGAANEAVQILRRLLAMPAGETVSIRRLEIDPVWDPIRNDPGFQQLLTSKELIGPNK